MKSVHIKMALTPGFSTVLGTVIQILVRIVLSGTLVFVLLTSSAAYGWIRPR